MTKQTRPSIAAALVALSALAATGCGGSGDTGGAPVTVTVTPTVTATPTPSTSKAEEPEAPKSDVVGRGYDFGTVTALDTVAGTEVITLDRWTFKGLDDAKLARDGVPLAPFTGRPFQNQNDKLTYDIPVAADARILYHHCTAKGEPQQTRSATMKEMADLEDRESLVLVQLDDQGRAVAVDNLPGCPD
jgi:hypothetical protein